MEITVDRKYKKENYTIGLLSIDGELVCNTLEDRDRGLDDSMTLQEINRRKVKGKTAIPTGRYEIVLFWSSKRKNARYARDGKIPMLTRVRGFSYIEIHSGNTENDTEGCILCGKNDVKGMVTNSVHWTTVVCNRIYEAFDRNEKVYITIK